MAQGGQPRLAPRRSSCSRTPLGAIGLSIRGNFCHCRRRRVRCRELLVRSTPQSNAPCAHRFMQHRLQRIECKYPTRATSCASASVRSILTSIVVLIDGSPTPTYAQARLAVCLGLSLRAPLALKKNGFEQD
jgi:hypothetical protein